MSLNRSGLKKMINWKPGILFKFQFEWLIEVYAKLSHFQTILV